MADQTALLQQWFSRIDVNNDGYLTAAELQSALALGDMHFSLSTVAHLLRMYSTNRAGTVSVNEFEDLFAFLENTKATFHYFDQEKKGTLSYDEVRKALAHSGYTLEPASMTAVQARFDPLATGAINFMQFMELVLFMHGATTAFNAFDTSETGITKLNFYQFLHACTYTL